METKHTSGKWELDVQSTFQLAVVCNNKAICFIPKMADNHEANALLISKAPELLEELQSMLFLFDRGLNEDSVGKQACNRVRELIKQSTL